MITGAIFDVDGTLLNSMYVWDNAGEWYLEGMGIEAEPGLGAVLYPMTMEDGAGYLQEHYGLRMSLNEIFIVFGYSPKREQRIFFISFGKRRFLWGLPPQAPGSRWKRL